MALVFDLDKKRGPVPPAPALGSHNTVHALFAGTFVGKGFAACFLAPLGGCGRKGRGLRRINGVRCRSGEAIGRNHNTIGVALVSCFPIMTTVDTAHDLLPSSHKNHLQS